MPKKIIWSLDSERDLEDIMEYLSSEWETSVAVRFLDIIEDLTEQI